MIKKIKKSEKLILSLLAGILIGVSLTFLGRFLFVKSDIQKSKDAITAKFLNKNSLDCTDPTDPVKPKDRISAFKDYLKVNKLNNRAIILGCNDNVTLLVKRPDGQWFPTEVNLTKGTRVNPAWQNACLIQDITTADTINRPENESIDADNLKMCEILDRVYIPQIDSNSIGPDFKLTAF